jgi:nitroreductase
MTTSELINTLEWRYATKQFDAAKKIDDATWHTLAQSLVLTPSSFGLQPWRFLIVQNPATREALLPHAWGQRQVTDCSHLVVMTVRTSLDVAYIDRFLADTAAKRGASVESLNGYRDMMVGFLPKMTADWAARQAYIALGQFMLAAASLKVDTCPMEGFVPAEFDRVLGLEDGWKTCVLCPAGYRSTGDKYATAPKIRWAPADVLATV